MYSSIIVFAHAVALTEVAARFILHAVPLPWIASDQFWKFSSIQTTLLLAFDRSWKNYALVARLLRIVNEPFLRVNCPRFSRAHPLGGASFFRNPQKRGELNTTLQYNSFLCQFVFLIMSSSPSVRRGERYLRTIRSTA